MDEIKILILIQFIKLIKGFITEERFLMKKKIIASLLVSMSIIGFMPTCAQAVWKKDSYNNNVWVEANGIKQGWKQIDNFWYYLGADGVPITGWLKDGEDWYYMWSNGTMAYDTWMTNGGFWYYFDHNGKMVTDSVTVENKEYDFTKMAIILSKYVDGSAHIVNGVQAEENVQSVQNADSASGSNIK